MVNPSKANALKNDSTINKVEGFMRHHGWAKSIVVNLFALCATDVKELARAKDPIGPFNDHYLGLAFEEADLIIVAWGSSKKFPRGYEGRYLDVMDAVPAGKKVMSIGFPCNDGHPRHPLYLSYEERLHPWRAK